MSRDSVVALRQHRVNALLIQELAELVRAEVRFWQTVVGVAWIGMLAFFVIDIIV